tara:strand:+ start:12166 stop:13134 length:969 start_codon:yes stop_codon:yes gene_type:complete
MPGTLLKTFEIFPHTEAIKNLEAEIATEEKLMRSHRDYWRELSIDSAKAMRAMKSIEHAMESNTYWDYAKVAGGNSVLAGLIEQRIKKQFDDLSHAYQRSQESISDNQESYNNRKQTIFNKKNAKLKLKIKNQKPTVYSTDVWDHMLQDSPIYVPKSLKVREFTSDYSTAVFKYKFTLRTKPLKAKVINVELESRTFEECADEDDNIFINIPGMSVDFIRHTYGSAEVRFRAINRDDRVSGYVTRGQIHPHQTSVTSPCLGDFGPPIYEAVTDFDIPMAVTVLELFLKQVDSHDGAGRYWKRWWDKDKREWESRNLNQEEVA